MFCTLSSLLSRRNAGGFSAGIPCSLQHCGLSWCRAGGGNYRHPCYLALQKFVPLGMSFHFQKDSIWYKAKSHFPAACTVTLHFPVVLGMKVTWGYAISLQQLNHHCPPEPPPQIQILFTD